MKKSTLQITFLGTGPAVAIPRLGHNDQTCRDAKKQGSKTRRLRSSLLVSYENANILIDAGPDFTKQAKNIHDDLNAVFLTHKHLDAIGGLHDLRAWAATKKIKLPLYCLRATWMKIADDFTPLKPNFVKVNQSVKVGGLTITPFHLRHGIKHDVPTLGFYITVSSIDSADVPARNVAAATFRARSLPIKSFIYASDMDGAPTASRKFFRKASLVIIDSAMWFGRKFNGHFNPEQAIKFLCSCTSQKSLPSRSLRITPPANPQKVILTQIGHSWPPYKQAIKRLNDFCKKNKIPFPVLTAYDGLKIKI